MYNLTNNLNHNLPEWILGAHKEVTEKACYPEGWKVQLQSEASGEYDFVFGETKIK